MQVGLKGALDCITAFSETDFTDDLARIDVPVFVAHGDDDQVVPVDAGGRRAAAMLQEATLKVYAGAPHGLCGAYEHEFDEDLLGFLRS
jgi:non-heme chloroperoxidase